MTPPRPTVAHRNSPVQRYHLMSFLGERIRNKKNLNGLSHSLVGSKQVTSLWCEVTDLCQEFIRIRLFFVVMLWFYSYECIVALILHYYQRCFVFLAKSQLNWYCFLLHLKMTSCFYINTEFLVTLYVFHLDRQHLFSTRVLGRCCEFL